MATTPPRRWRASSRSGAGLAACGVGVAAALLARIAAAAGQQEADDGNTEISHHVIYLPGIPAGGNAVLLNSAVVRGLLLDLTPLRGREFRLLFLGQLVSFFGSMITFVALPFQMYDLTGSTLAVGALGICEFVPILAVALVSGALADAFDRRLLVVFSELGSAVVMAALLGNALLDEPHAWVLFVCAAVLAGFYALLRPPLDSLVPRVVPREQLKAAMALEWVRGNVGMIAGPAIGGVLIAAFGVPLTYGIDLATFLISLGFLALMRASPPPADADAPEPALDRRGPALRGQPAGAARHLPRRHQRDAVRDAAGALPGDRRGLRRRRGARASCSPRPRSARWSSRCSAAGRGTCTATAARWRWRRPAGAWRSSPSASPNVLWLALACLAVAGAMDAISGLFRSVIWNETIPDRLRGRLAGVEMISYTSGPTLGNFEAGALASLTSVRTSVVSGGVLCVAGTAVLVALLPAFWRYDARREVGGRPPAAAAPPAS